MSTVKDYQAVIDILTNGFDANLVAKRLAKHHPDIFIKMVETDGNSADDTQWHRDVIRYDMTGNHVGAIKEIRMKTGLGLKEAKDINDNFVNALAELGYDIKRKESVYTLTHFTNDVLKKLVETAYTAKQYYV